MKALIVVENCQEGVEAGVGYASILGIFLINPENRQKAVDEAEKCLRVRYDEAVYESAEGTIEQENEPAVDENGVLNASWVETGNDTAHFLDVREADVTQC